MYMRTAESKFAMSHTCYTETIYTDETSSKSFPKNAID